eukprot:270856-Pleurochrysis_carterae.AAC.2
MAAKACCGGEVGPAHSRSPWASSPLLRSVLCVALQADQEGWLRSEEEELSAAEKAVHPVSQINSSAAGLLANGEERAGDCSDASRAHCSFETDTVLGKKMSMSLPAIDRGCADTSAGEKTESLAIEDHSVEPPQCISLGHLLAAANGLASQIAARLSHTCGAIGEINAWPFELLPADCLFC